MFNSNKLIGAYLYDMKSIDIGDVEKNGLLIVTDKGVTVLTLSAEYNHDCWITELSEPICQGRITEVQDDGYLLVLTTETGRNYVEARAEWGYETWWNESGRQII